MKNRRHDMSRPSRRDLLRWGGGTGAILITASSGTVLAGCGFFSTDPEEKKKSGSKGTGDDGGLESPMLAEQVKSGDLPELSERLPENPLVVEPAEGPGVYGGTFKSPMLGPGDNAWPDRIMGYEFPLRYDPTGTEIGPGICEQVDVSDDGTEFTFHLRAGMRWSDGEPFTTEDIQFGWDDVVFNADVWEVPPREFLGGDDEPATLTVVDEATFTLTYATPRGRLYPGLALGPFAGLFDRPKHYLQQFHLEYDETVIDLAEEEGQEDWVALFWAKQDPFENPDRPTLNAWVLTSPASEGQHQTWSRNPYYWKTDPEGRQLPYIDELSFEIIEEEQVMLLKAAEGEVDMSSRHFNSMVNRPVLADGREKGDFRFVEIENTVMNDMVIALNLAHKNKRKREIYQEKDFRVGLSLAIDREELITAIWQRQGEPYQCAPDPRSEFYDEEFAKQYTEYDLEEANRLLDGVLPDKDGDGFRLMPNGDRLVVNVEVPQPTLIPVWVDAMDLIVQMWEKAGVKGRVDSKDRTLFYERKAWDVNELDAGVWMGDGGLKVELAEARWYMPWSGESLWATPWAEWFTSRGARGEEPPEAPKRQMELYRDIEAEPDLEKQKDIFREILQIAKEEFYAIGTIRIENTYGIVKNDLKGLPETWPESYLFRSPAVTNTTTWYFDDSQ